MSRCLRKKERTTGEYFPRKRQSCIRCELAADGGVILREEQKRGGSEIPALSPSSASRYKQDTACANVPVVHTQLPICACAWVLVKWS